MLYLRPILEVTLWAGNAGGDMHFKYPAHFANSWCSRDTTLIDRIGIRPLLRQDLSEPKQLCFLSAISFPLTSREHVGTDLVQHL